MAAAFALVRAAGAHGKELGLKEAVSLRDVESNTTSAPMMGAEVVDAAATAAGLLAREAVVRATDELPVMHGDLRGDSSASVHSPPDDSDGVISRLSGLLEPRHASERFSPSLK